MTRPIPTGHPTFGLPTACLTILVLLSGPVLAQKSPARQRLGGYVLDKEGEGWVGAQVHLVSRILPGNEWIGEPDRIVVQSGKRGRFSAQVLPRREYLVWAVSEPESSVYRSTDALTNVVAGPIRLRERVDPLVQVRFRIGGDPHWKPPFHIKVTGAPAQLALGDRRVGDPHEVFRVTVDEAGLARMPLLPWPEVTVEIQDRRGVQLWAPMVSLSLALRRAALEPGPEPVAAPPDSPPREKVQSLTESLLEIPPPAPRKARVTDEKGTPLPGVSLGQRIRGHFQEITTSDAQGWLTLDLPIRTVTHWDRIFRLRGNCRSVVRKSGYLEIAAGIPLPPQEEGGKPHTIEMTPSKGYRGRILRSPGEPLAHHPLVLYVKATGQVHRPVLLQTDAEGRFTITQRIRQAWLLKAILDDATCRRLSGDDEVPVSSQALLSSLGPQLLADEFEVDLSRLRRVEFDLIRPDRSPASFAHVDVFRIKGFNMIPPLLQARADRRGRVAILMGACQQALIVAQDDQGYATMGIQEYAEKKQLLLTGLLRLSGIIEDKEGVPIAGAQVRIDHAFVNKMGHKIGRSPLRGLTMGFQLGHRFCDRTDVSGRFSIRVPAGAESVPLWITRRGSTERIERKVEMHQISQDEVRIRIR